MKKDKKIIRLTKRFGTDPISGKPRVYDATGRTKKEALQKIERFTDMIKAGYSFDEARERMKSNLYDVDTKIKRERTLRAAMRSWLFDVKRVADNVKPSSFSVYEGLFRLYIESFDFSKIAVEDLKSNDLQRHYNRLYEEENKTHATIYSVNKLIKAFYNYEIEQERIHVNPCAGKKIQIPGKAQQKEQTKIMSREDFEKFTAALKDSRFGFMFLLAASTGLRIGEIIALKLSEIDIERQEIRVVATQYACAVFDADGNHEYKKIRSSTKNRLSRVVPIPSSIVPALRRHMTARAILKMKNRCVFDDEGYLFPNERGGVLEYANVRKKYLKIFEIAGIDYVRIHSLRHLYASMLVETGAHISNIQSLLGHTDISTTQLYIHSSEDERRKDVERLDIPFHSKEFV